MYFDLLLSRIEEMNENDSVRCYLCIMSSKVTKFAVKQFQFLNYVFQ